MRMIVKQPNGKFCVYSTIADDCIMWDMTPEDIINEYVNEYRQEISNKITEDVSELNKGGKPYGQFTRTFEGIVEDLEREVAYGNRKSEFLDFAKAFLIDK